LDEIYVHYIGDGTTTGNYRKAQTEAGAMISSSGNFHIEDILNVINEKAKIQKHKRLAAHIYLDMPGAGANYDRILDLAKVWNEQGIRRLHFSRNLAKIHLRAVTDYDEWVVRTQSISEYNFFERAHNAKGKPDPNPIHRWKTLGHLDL